MRAAVFALIIAVVGPSFAHAKTLLETVLYIVSLHEQKDNKNERITVEQDDRVIHSVFVPKSPQPDVRFVVTIKRIADCKFEVDHQIGGFSARYTLDFAKSIVEQAHVAIAPNKFGRQSDSVGIPGTRYCLISGRPYLNAVSPGSCRDEFYVDPGPVPKLKNQQKMLDTIRQLRDLCVAETS